MILPCFYYKNKIVEGITAERSVPNALSTATIIYQRMMRKHLLGTQFETWKRQGVCHFQGTGLTLS
jgi:hypothetical protein